MTLPQGRTPQEADQATTARGAVIRDRDLLGTCVAAAVQAAEVIRLGAERRDRIAWREKSRSDFVSEIDEGAEQVIRGVIHTRHAGAAVIGEEHSPGEAFRGGDGISFVVDPLDGTTNFLHGYPWYAVSIAAMVGSELRAGAVLNVTSGEMFTAVLGGGARRNGQPIAVSTIQEPARALLGTGFPFKHPDLVAPYMAMLPDLMLATAGIRRAGSAALDLADVACGRFDAFWELRLAPWDVAAGILLVREAGGIVTDLAGNEATVVHGGYVAGNPVMHRWLLDRVTR